VSKLELLSIEEAMLKSATGKSAQIVREYVGYIERLEKGQVGTLESGDGDSAQAIKRRLGAVAKLLNKKLVIKRAGDIVCFWMATRPNGRRRRPRKGR